MQVNQKPHTLRAARPAFLTRQLEDSRQNYVPQTETPNPKPHPQHASLMLISQF